MGRFASKGSPGIERTVMLDNLPRPTIFAHRGASAHAPENTISAFKLAAHLNADAIELDAKLSADGHVVVIHDQTVDRTTPSSGQVGDLSLSELRTLDAGSHFDITYKNETIPTLDEVFGSCGGEIYINVELTNYASIKDDLPDKVAQLVKKHKLEENILISSFNPVALRRVNRLLPEVPIGFLSLPGRKGMWARSRLGRFFVPYQALHPELGDASTSMVKRVHQLGQRVHVYTVNRAQDLRCLFELDVDGIFTDDVPLAKEILKSITY
jgi:glycerophosphoryl diester phosphodiesterase